MCEALQIPRSTCYYEAKPPQDESKLNNAISEIFRISRNNYGTQKLKHELTARGILAARRRVGRIMKQEGLVSTCTTAQFRPHKDTCNEYKIENIVDRHFDEQPYRNFVVSDLTYVRFGVNWNCICVLVNLFNREIIGYSVGRHKTASLIKQAFQSVRGNLGEIQIFHTDRSNEFKNHLIDETLETFHIRRSLSQKGCPYDNAVAEAIFKIIMTEFVKNQSFDDLYHLQPELADYVNWFSHRRIHSSLGYLRSLEEVTLKMLSRKVLTIQDKKVPQ